MKVQMLRPLKRQSAFLIVEDLAHGILVQAWPVVVPVEPFEIISLLELDDDHRKIVHVDRGDNLLESPFADLIFDRLGKNRPQPLSSGVGVKNSLGGFRE